MTRVNWIEKAKELYEECCGAEEVKDIERNGNIITLWSDERALAEYNIRRGTLEVFGE